MRQRANRTTWVERIRSWKSSGKSAEEFAAGQPYKPKTVEHGFDETLLRAVVHALEGRK